LGFRPAKEGIVHEEDKLRVRAAQGRPELGVAGAVRLSDVDSRHDLAIAALFAASSPVYSAVAAFPTSARIGVAGSGGGGPCARRSASCAAAAASTARSSGSGSGSGSSTGTVINI